MAQSPQSRHHNPSAASGRVLRLLELKIDELFEIARAQGLRPRDWSPFLAEHAKLRAIDTLREIDKLPELESPFLAEHTKLHEIDKLPSPGAQAKAAAPARRNHSSQISTHTPALRESSHFEFTVLLSLPRISRPCSSFCKCHPGRSNRDPSPFLNALGQRRRWSGSTSASGSSGFSVSRYTGASRAQPPPALARGGASTSSRADRCD